MKRLIRVCVVMSLLAGIYLYAQNVGIVGGRQEDSTQESGGYNVVQEIYPKEPGISRVTEDILEISISVGSPARYVFYFNTKNSNISETYFNPIIVGDNYVAYMENGELILRDIFCEDLMKMRIVRDFSQTADPMSAVMQIEVVGDENIMLTYLKGADYEEVSEKIKIENDTERLP